jgi:hypothetical protein
MTLSPNETAIRLVNKFTMYGFIRDGETSDLMVMFAKFAATQHITEITTPDMDPEQIIYNMQVVSAISNLEISYPYEP